MNRTTAIKDSVHFGPHGSTIHTKITLFYKMIKVEGVEKFLCKAPSLNIAFVADSFEQIDSEYEEHFSSLFTFFDEKGGVKTTLDFLVAQGFNPEQKKLTTMSELYKGTNKGKKAIVKLISEEKEFEVKQATAKYAA